ncbi:hypothetical protein F2Q68_00028026 [Brassica cretica]|uniref:Uncharacterized protein n=1 Tax=Brassica cretica TaxID=69181 RepID=A0A8S9IFT8_BRACR|nr:hypothetical protein F2Q68_00028026 [Brassica cretica]
MVGNRKPRADYGPLGKRKPRANYGSPLNLLILLALISSFERVGDIFISW